MEGYSYIIIMNELWQSISNLSLQSIVCGSKDNTNKPASGSGGRPLRSERMFEWPVFKNLPNQYLKESKNSHVTNISKLAI